MIRVPLRAPRIFYGWWIVLGSIVLLALGGGLFLQAYGAYFVHLQRDLGWSKTALSGAFSLAQAENGLLGPIQGWLVDKLGPRAVIRAGIVIFGLGLVLLSRTDSLLVLYGAVLVIAVGASLSGLLTVNSMLANWFERRRSTAMGLATAGFGASGMIIPVVAWALNAFGWRTTAFSTGLLVILVGLPVAQIMRRAPEPYGYLPDGGPRRSPAAQGSSAPVDAPSRAQPAAGSFTVGQALRSPAFWLLNAGWAASVLAVSATLVHLIPHLVNSLQMSLATAALVMSLMTTLSLVGQVTGGFIGDRLDKRAICAVCLVGQMVGLVALAVATSLPLILFFVVVNGLAWGVRGPLMAAIRADYFGRASFATIFGFSLTVVTIAGVIGPLFAGFMADQRGDYRLGFTVLALVAGAGSVFFLLARKPALPQPRV